MRTHHFFRLLGALLLVTMQLANASTSYAQNDLLIWAQVGGIPSTVNINSVDMLDTNTAWLAGDDGQSGFAYRLTWNGTRWEASRQGIFPTPVREIVAVSYEDAWAVADGGVVVRRNNNGWQLPDFRIPDSSLTALQVTPDGRELFVGGQLPAPDANSAPRPVFAYGRDGAWSQDTTIPGEGAVHALSFIPGTAGYVVGDHIWRFADGQWSQESEPPACGENFPCPFDLLDVQAISADEAWAVGDRIGMCAICVFQPYIIHRTAGTWQLFLAGTYQVGVEDWREGRERHNGSGLLGVSFADADTGWAVGWETPASNNVTQPMVLRYADEHWSYAAIPAINGRLKAVSAADATHVLAVGERGLVLAYGYGQQPVIGPNVVERVPNPNDPAISYFDQTGHTLRGAFRSYWQRKGGLAQFGYPLTEEFVENGYTVQYFERARFEHHPENQPPYDVLLGLLARTVTAGREDEAPFRPVPPHPGWLYSPETGHTIAPEFAAFWERTGGLPVYGYPISEAFMEQNVADGQFYTVQYFERNRMEFHPELPPAYRVSLGLLGSEILRNQGWLP